MITLHVIKYLNVLPSNLFVHLARLRLSSHNLRVESGRYTSQRIDYEQRYCNFCHAKDIEDEYHFVLICPVYSKIRTKFIKPYYRVKPSVNKCIDLLKTDKIITLLNLAKYLREAFAQRMSLVNIT